MNLTERFIERIKTSGKRQSFWEELPRGTGTFGIRVSPSGSKTWIVKYQDPRNKKTVWKTYGKYPDMSSSDAREKALDILSDISIESKKPNEFFKQEFTCAMFFTIYLEKWAKITKKSWKEDERIINVYLTPIIGNIPLKKVSKKEIISVVDKIIENNAPIMANRTYALLSKIFSFAVQRGEIEISPMIGTKKPAKENKKDRTLDEQELELLLRVIIGNIPTGREEDMANLMLFQLATACRPSEARTLEWIDIKPDHWIIPKEKAKNGISNVIPLTDFTRKILHKQQRNSCSSFVFVSRVTGKQYYETSQTRSIRRIYEKFNIKPFTSHDLRRTATSYIAKLGVARNIVKKILNHVDNDVTAIYDRHDYDSEIKDALQRWNQILFDIISKFDSSFGE